jgi:hypothetical protein
VLAVLLLLLSWLLLSLSLLLRMLQGERCHQQLADDAGALPGGTSLQPAAPRG